MLKILKKICEVICHNIIAIVFSCVGFAFTFLLFGLGSWLTADGIIESNGYLIAGGIALISVGCIGCLCFTCTCFFCVDWSGDEPDEDLSAQQPENSSPRTDLDIRAYPDFPRVMTEAPIVVEQINNNRYTPFYSHVNTNLYTDVERCDDSINVNQRNLRLQYV